jgi:CDGSH-type Zn-finger protein
MADNATNLTFMNDGPVIVKGEFECYDQSGNPLGVSEKGQVALCRCGGSSKKPFCDGSHKQGFESKIDANELAK